MLSLNILFPVFNEEKRIIRGIEATSQYLLENFSCEYEITIIDNGSTDKTEEISYSLCEKYPFVHYIKIDEKGVGAAFRAGIKCNSYDIVGYMDIDLSTDIKYLEVMYDIFLHKSDVQIINASRLNKNSVVIGRKWYRNLTSHGLAFLIRINFGIKATDIICGFKFFRKLVAEQLIRETEEDNGWFYIIEMLIRADKKNIKIHELPVRWVDDYNTTVQVEKIVAYYINRIIDLKKRLKHE